MVIVSDSGLRGPGFETRESQSKTIFLVLHSLHTSDDNQDIDGN